MLKLLLVFSLFYLNALPSYHQNDYIIKLERTELKSYNKQHVSYAKAYNSKFNRTHFGTTFTLKFLTDFDNKLLMKLQTYKFASNEYRFFPITLEINICATINKNDFGIQNLYQCGNFTKCPMKKGNYVICNWAPDQAYFPPYIPHGSYMAEANMTYLGTEVAVLQAYLLIKDFM